MTQSPPLAATSVTRRELAKLGPRDAAYLKSVSKQLSATFDVAMVVGDVVLPAHSYILAASSAIFADKLAGQDDDKGSLTRPSSKPYIISLMEDDHDAQSVQAALQFMYNAYPPSEGRPNIETQAEAELLAQFGCKYGMQFPSGCKRRLPVGRVEGQIPPPYGFQQTL